MSKGTCDESVLIVDEMSKSIVETAEQIATEEGAHAVTVRRILKSLDITNRVFYNRFHNVDEVLGLVYQNMAEKIRSDVVSRYDGKQDYFEYVMDVIERSLVIAYDTKMRFNQFAFESDSVTETNYEWWTGQIKSLIDYAKEKNLIKDVDSEILSYSIWCFCRGYNADAALRGVPRDEAIAGFRYSFSFLLEGLKKSPSVGV